MTGPGDMFAGKRVLVVEGEIPLPFTLFRAIERLGAEVVGPVTFPEDVVLLARDAELDGAILDSRIPPEERSAVEAFLRQKGVAYVEACDCLDCVSGRDGCFKLAEAEADLAILGRALFGRRHPELAAARRPF